jgi:hypothetical protein
MAGATKRGQFIVDPKALASLNDSTFSEDANQVGDTAVFWRIRAVPCLRQRQCGMQMSWIIRGWLDAGKRSGKLFQMLGLPVPNK